MIDQPRVARVPLDHVVGMDAFGREPTTYTYGNLLGRYRHEANSFSWIKKLAEGTAASSGAAALRRGACHYDRRWRPSPGEHYGAAGEPGLNA
jgi:hypothetical protein